MDFFVFPHFEKSEKDLSQFPDCGRLFAYPCVPKFQDCKIVILDSGAYGLFESGRKMGANYFKKLSAHYEKFYTEKTICVAPDVVCDPMLTMTNFKKWHKLNLFEHIAPVIQPSTKQEIDFDLYKYQIDFYTKNYNSKILFFSNWLTADMAIGQGIQKIVDYARSKKVEYIHIFGAGWNVSDVKQWHSVNGVSSCDSIAYYTAGCEQRFGSKDPAENARRIIYEISKNYSD